MAKVKRQKLKVWPFVIALVVIVLFGVFSLSKNKESFPQQKSTEYSVYQNSSYGFSINYPKSWEIRKDTQVFENGDAVAFRKTGLTQKEQTELSDGGEVVVSKPFGIKTELVAWVKDSYNSKSEFSQNTINGRIYQKVYQCGLGCITYYYTFINNQVYGVATFAQGPDKDKVVYENAIVFMLNSLQFTNANTNTRISKDEAVAKVKALPEVSDYLKRVPNGLIAVNGEEEDTYMIQVYEFKDNHTATFNWYDVDKNTGEVEKQF